MTTPIVEMRGIQKHFGAVHALRNVNFHAHAGRDPRPRRRQLRRQVDADEDDDGRLPARRRRRVRRWPAHASFIAALIALSAIALLAFNLIRVNRRLKYEKQLVQIHTEQLTANNALLDSIIDNIPIMVTLKRATT